MSKQVEVKIYCPVCGTRANTSFYRSIWVEFSENRNLIMNDEINVFSCPSCRAKSKIEFPFLCTNVKDNIAIWYEPFHDPSIDEEIRQYSKTFGPDSFYAQAPRIREWSVFKAKLIEMETTPDPDLSRSQISPELHSTFLGMVKSIDEQKTKLILDYSNTSRLQDPIKRLKLALFIGLITLFIILVLSRHLPRLDETYEVVVVYSLFAGVAFAFLSVLNKIVHEGKLWRDKLFRQYCFFAGIWVVSVFLYVIINSDDYTYEEDLFRMFLIAVIPPGFIGLASYIYKKYIE